MILGSNITIAQDSIDSNLWEETVLDEYQITEGNEAFLVPEDIRTVEDEELDYYRKHPAYDYTERKKEKKRNDFSERETGLLKILGSFLERFGGLIRRVLFWGIIGLAVVTILYFVLKVQFSNFRKPASTKLGGIEFSEVEDDIHQIDFETQLKKALAEENYRKAVRLLYLQSLKLLTDVGRIDWQPEKTNYDYMHELGRSPLVSDFERLTLRYNYIVYGEFPVNLGIYQDTEQVFRQFQQKIVR